MANLKKPIAIVLVVIGAICTGALLFMAIRGELMRDEGKHQVSKLVIIASDTKEGAVQGRNLKNAYQAFLKYKLDTEAAYLTGQHTSLDDIVKTLNLTSSDQDSETHLVEMHTHQEVFNRVYQWLSPEGTEQEDDAETVTKQLCVMRVDQKTFELLIGKLNAESFDADILAIEAWPKMVKLFIMQGDSLNALRELVNLHYVQIALCPSSGPEDQECKPPIE